MKDTTKKIRIGRGPFNDIIINDDNVQMEHCNIIYDMTGYRVVNIGRGSNTFINNDEIKWEAPIIPNQELRVGNSIVTWEQIENAMSDVQNAAKSDQEGNLRRVGMFVGYYLIYILLIFFVLYSFFISSFVALRVISICLFIGYVLYTIEPSKRNKERMTEKDLDAWKRNRKVILILTAGFLINFVVRLFA